MQNDCKSETTSQPPPAVPACGPPVPAATRNHGLARHTNAVHATRTVSIPCHMNVGTSTTASHAPLVHAREACRFRRRPEPRQQNWRRLAPVACGTQCLGPHTHTTEVHATQMRPIPCQMNVSKSTTASHAPPVPERGPPEPAGDPNPAGEIVAAAHGTQCPGPHTHTTEVHVTQMRPIPCHMDVSKSTTASHAPPVPARGPPEPAGDPNPAGEVVAAVSVRNALVPPHTTQRKSDQYHAK